MAEGLGRSNRFFKFCWWKDSSFGDIENLVFQDGYLRRMLWTSIATKQILDLVELFKANFVETRSSQI